MCRLLGLMADLPVNLTYWMIDAPHSFRSLSDYHAHGWGIGWHDSGVPHLVKEPISALNSEKFPNQVKTTLATEYLCHIRKATCGEHTMCNSHPFQYGNYLFAHNGTVDADFLRTKLNASHLGAIEGQTDSEVYFHFLLQSIESDPVNGLAEAIRIVRSRKYTALNFLLADPTRLFAFWQQSETAKPLFPEYYRLYLKMRSRTESNAREVVVCSEMLDETGWQPLPAGALLTVNEDLSWNYGAIS